MRRRRLLGLLGAAAATGLPRAARAADRLRVAEQPIDSSLEATYAQVHGFAARAGLELNIEMLPSNGAANLAAIVGGNIDIAISNTFTALAAHERGVPIAIVAPSSVYSSKAPTTFLMVPKDSPIRSAPDLNEKTIAVNGLRNITQFGPMAWVDKNGGDAKTLRFVEMPFADMPVALASRRVDAAVLAEPFASRASEARVLTPAFDGIAPSFLVSVWVAARPWIEAKGPLCARYARMLYRTAAWANRNRETTAPTLLEVTHLDPSSLKSLVRATFAERYDPGLLAPVIDVALRYGGITKPVRPQELAAPGMPVSA